VRSAMTRRCLSLWLGIVIMAAATLARPVSTQAQEEVKAAELTRKARIKVAPEYPAVARGMNITGIVKLAVVVAPNGTVKNAKVVGGHPILVNAAMNAMKQWRFEPAPTESRGTVEFKFQPQDEIEK
jgi:TonB family protein